MITPLATPCAMGLPASLTPALIMEPTIPAARFCSSGRNAPGRRQAVGLSRLAAGVHCMNLCCQLRQWTTTAGHPVTSLSYPPCCKSLGSAGAGCLLVIMRCCLHLYLRKWHFLSLITACH